MKALQAMNPALPLELVKLETKDEYEKEGRTLKNALGYFFDRFVKDGVTVYSARQEGATLLALSVRPDGVCAHIVGLYNRAPTDEELAAVTQLLADKDIETRYDPSTVA